MNSKKRQEKISQLGLRVFGDTPKASEVEWFLERVVRKGNVIVFVDSLNPLALEIGTESFEFKRIDDQSFEFKRREVDTGGAT